MAYFNAGMLFIVNLYALLRFIISQLCLAEKLNLWNFKEHLIFPTYTSFFRKFLQISKQLVSIVNFH